MVLAKILLSFKSFDSNWAFTVQKAGFLSLNTLDTNLLQFTASCHEPGLSFSDYPTHAIIPPFILQFKKKCQCSFVENLTWYTSNFLPGRKYSPDPAHTTTSCTSFQAYFLPVCGPGQVTDTWRGKLCFTLTGFLYKSLPAVHCVQPEAITQSEMALLGFLMFFFFFLSMSWWCSHHLRNMRKEKRKHTALWSQITQTIQYFLTVDNQEIHISEGKPLPALTPPAPTPDHSSFPVHLANLPAFLSNRTDPGSKLPFSTRTNLPPSSFWKSLPQGVSAHHSLDQLLPKHSFRDHALPFFTHQLCGTQRPGVQVGKNVFCYVI